MGREPHSSMTTAALHDKGAGPASEEGLQLL